MVMVSTKGRYALRVMVDLAKNQGDSYLPLKEIAQRQGISEKYLESVLKGLVAGKMLTGVRGKGGGYRLSRRPEEYTVADILRLTEGEIAAVACLEKGALPCPRQQDCPTLPLWRNLNALVQDYFSSVTLRDLAGNVQESADSAAPALSASADRTST